MFLASETGVSDFSGTGDTAYYCSVLLSQSHTRSKLKHRNRGALRTSELLSVH